MHVNQICLAAQTVKASEMTSHHGGHGEAERVSRGSMLQPHNSIAVVCLDSAEVS